MQNFLFETKFLRDHIPVLIAKLPKEINEEIEEWAYECKKIKEHPLSYLKGHSNVGYDPDNNIFHNSYQCSVPPHLVSNSYWLAYTTRLTGLMLNTDNRNIRLRDYPGHFDNYDIWANFSYEGDFNPNHTHAGDISGVIYCKNENQPTIFPDFQVGYGGNNGTMALFPSDTLHCVNPQKSKNERITFAFNLIQTSS